MPTVPNRGQHHDDVHFTAQGQAGTVWFTDDEAMLAVPTNHIYGHERLLNSNGAWYQHDGLGSVRTILDGGGAIQSTTSYDPWGVSVSPGVGIPQGSFGFTGELHDDNLVHLRARWYNPNLGTFTSRDPFAGFATLPYSQHPYQYAYSNPVLLTDPSGKFVPALAGSIAAGAALGAGVEIGSQMYDQYRRTGRVDLGNLCAEDIAYAALSGAIAGGIGFFGGPAASAVFGRGLGGSIVAGAVEGAISDSAATATLLLLRGQPVTADAMIQAAFSGALGGGVGGAIGRMWGPSKKANDTATAGISTLTRQERIDLLVSRLGTSIQTHPLRQEYQNAVENIANITEALKRERGMSQEALRGIAYEAWSMRRQLGIKYKNATPLALRDYIYVVNKERYQDPLGPSFQNRVEYYEYNYERMIERAAVYNDKVDKLLGDFGAWLAEQSDDQLERYMQDILTR